VADRPSIDPVRAGATPCPDLNLLAGSAEERLEGAERASVATHLASCADCRDAVAAVRASLAPEPAGRPSRRTVLRWIPAAAVALIAAGVALRFSGGLDSPSASTDARLRESAGVLGRAHPALFAGFRPLGIDELGREPSVLRSGAAFAAYPQERILERRPDLRWVSEAGDSPWRVRLLRQTDGARLMDSETTETRFALPDSASDLEPGVAYVWEAISDAATGRLEVRAAFSVATPDERRSLEEGFRIVDREFPADLAGLVKAHWAIRREFLGEAERLATEWVREHPGDPIGRGTAEFLRRRLGRSEEGP